jgi:hypothetical protein
MAFCDRSSSAVKDRSEESQSFVVPRHASCRHNGLMTKILWKGFEEKVSILNT